MTDIPIQIQVEPTDVWVTIRTGSFNVTGRDFDPRSLTNVQCAIVRGLLQAGLEAINHEPAMRWVTGLPEGDA